MQSITYIRELTQRRPRVAVVLGSGLGGGAEILEDTLSVDYAAIPGFGRATAQGHAGKLVFGRCSGLECVFMEGRLHAYEGYSPQELAVPVRTLRGLGVETLLLTNAAGAVNASLAPGQLVLIEDFINLSGVNPLSGPNDDTLGPRFPDMTHALSPRLRDMIAQAAREAGIPLGRGVYAMMHGPNYETPAEIRMLRILGADLVGMSTVPEILTGVHCGMEVAAVSCVTNMAAGVLDKPLSSEEVIQTAASARERLQRILRNTLAALSEEA